MTTEQTATLLLKDRAGSYFIVPQETLERGRVPAEHMTEMEHLMASAAPAETGDADAQGYVGFFAGVAAAIVVRAGFDLGYYLTSSYLSQPEQVVPTLDYSHCAEDTTPR
jgi:hypothetical protein